MCFAAAHWPWQRQGCVFEVLCMPSQWWLPAEVALPHLQGKEGSVLDYDCLSKPQKKKRHIAASKAQRAFLSITSFLSVQLATWETPHAALQQWQIGSGPLQTAHLRKMHRGLKLGSCNGNSKKPTQMMLGTFSNSNELLLIHTLFCSCLLSVTPSCLRASPEVTNTSCHSPGKSSQFSTCTKCGNTQDYWTLVLWGHPKIEATSSHSAEHTQQEHFSACLAVSCGSSAQRRRACQGAEVSGKVAFLKSLMRPLSNESSTVIILNYKGWGQGILEERQGYTSGLSLCQETNKR